ncbi:MAG: 2-C-methyl-D-erythritol 2,4-cyclodiphosphate synthase [Trueperaceae bacterium]|nr:2-C-methyl-D-erythritol 2,4-cyclodiphosphate synthase [Trueperaceae bacterium]
MDDLRIGFGEDAHRLAPGRPLTLGGVVVPGAERGAIAHSDGDALLHAVADALLSAWALGDIGQHFPDTDAAHAGLDSRAIVARARTLIAERAPDARLAQVSAVVTLDRPKLGPHRSTVAATLAGLLDLPVDRVGLTFKTSEGLAPDHVQARATVLWRAPVG